MVDITLFRSQAYWGYELVADNMDNVIEKHGLQKISLLRYVNTSK